MDVFRVPTAFCFRGNFSKCLLNGNGSGGTLTHYRKPRKVREGVNFAVNACWCCGFFSEVCERRKSLQN